LGCEKMGGEEAPRRSAQGGEAGPSAHNLAPSPLAQTPSKAPPPPGADQAREKENPLAATPSSVRRCHFSWRVSAARLDFKSPNLTPLPLSHRRAQRSHYPANRMRAHLLARLMISLKPWLLTPRP